MIGVLSTPCLMLIEALQNHFKYPERVFTLDDIYKSSLMYVMLLTNMMIYVVITAYLFSREYTESTLKTLIPIPISRSSFIIGKLLVLFLWIIMLTVVTWAGILFLSTIYHIFIGMSGFTVVVAVTWLFRLLVGNVLIFVTITPFAYVAEKTKGIVAPVIASAVIIMGSAALSNQDIGALYPWTATLFLVEGKMESIGYPILLAVSIIVLISILGGTMTIHYFNKEDLR
jgi:bacitracin transport system permease protein